MHATAMPRPRSSVGERFSVRQAPGADLERVAREGAGGPSLKLDDERRRQHLHALQALVDARGRAEQAEQRLRSRLIELAWPAALAAIAGGFAAIVGLRVAGL